MIGQPEDLGSVRHIQPIRNLFVGRHDDRLAEQGEFGQDHEVISGCATALAAPLTKHRGRPNADRLQTVGAGVILGRVLVEQLARPVQAARIIGVGVGRGVFVPESGRSASCASDTRPPNSCTPPA